MPPYLASSLMNKPRRSRVADSKEIKEKGVGLERLEKLDSFNFLDDHNILDFDFMLGVFAILVWFSFF